MSHRVSVIFLLSLIAACASTPHQELRQPVSANGIALTSYTIGAPICRVYEDPQCAIDQIPDRLPCTVECGPQGPTGCDTIECQACRQECEREFPIDCPRITVRAECSSCADDIVESVKVCNIPNIMPGGQPERVNVVVPCEQNWEGVGECTACSSQDEIIFPDAVGVTTAQQASLLGRRHCECPDPLGSSWTSICRVPVELPGFALD